MMMSLAAVIEIPATADGRTLSATLRTANQGDRTITVLNPDMGVPSPAMNWPYSNEAYQTFLLMSFGYLSLTVTDEGGAELPRLDLLVSATPVLRPPLELAPGDSFEVPISIGTFYELESKNAYRMTAEYGDQDLKVSAEARFVVP
jgi:hypothetical protein